MIVLRVAGAVVAVLLAVVTAILEIFFSGLRIGGVLVGVSALVAVVVNFWLPRYTYAAAGSRWVAFLPAVAWWIMIGAAITERPEGDLLLGNTWVSLATIFGGSVAFALGGMRLLVPPPRPVPGRGREPGPAGPGEGLPLAP